MYDLVDMVRHADELIINDLIHALAYRFEEISPDYELLFFTVEKKKDLNDQIDACIALMQRLKEEGLKKE